jgi:hypothetical protein
MIIHQRNNISSKWCLLYHYFFITLIAACTGAAATAMLAPHARTSLTFRSVVNAFRDGECQHGSMGWYPSCATSLKKTEG